MCSFRAETDLTAFGNFLTTLISEVHEAMFIVHAVPNLESLEMGWDVFFLEPSSLIENVHGHRRLLRGLISLNSIKQSFLRGKKTEVVFYQILYLKDNSLSVH